MRFIFANLYDSAELWPWWSNFEKFDLIESKILPFISKFQTICWVISEKQIGRFQRKWRYIQYQRTDTSKMQEVSELSVRRFTTKISIGSNCNNFHSERQGTIIKLLAYNIVLRNSVLYVAIVAHAFSAFIVMINNFLWFLFQISFLLLFFPRRARSIFLSRSCVVSWGDICIIDNVSSLLRSQTSFWFPHTVNHNPNFEEAPGW